MHQIARLLELPGNVGPSCPSPPSLNLHSLRKEAAAQRTLFPAPDQLKIFLKIQKTTTNPGRGRTSGSPRNSQGSSSSTTAYRPMFSAAGKVPGAAAMLRDPPQQQHPQSQPSSPKATGKQNPPPFSFIPIDLFGCVCLCGFFFLPPPQAVCPSPHLHAWVLDQSGACSPRQTFLARRAMLAFSKPTTFPVAPCCLPSPTNTNLTPHRKKNPLTTPTPPPTPPAAPSTSPAPPPPPQRLRPLTARASATADDDEAFFDREEEGGARGADDKPKPKEESETTL